MTFPLSDFLPRIASRRRLRLCQRRVGDETRRALITGVTGQDGAYLSRFLLDHDYEVYGTTRRHDLTRLRALGVAERVRVVPADLGDVTVLEKTLAELQPKTRSTTSRRRARWPSRSPSRC